MKKSLLMIAAVAAGSLLAHADNYRLVTSVDQLDAGAKCVIGSVNEQKAMGTYQATAYRVATAAEIAGGVLKSNDNIAVVTIDKTDKGYTLTSNGGYLYAKGGNNRLGTIEGDPTDDCYATINIIDGNAVIEFGGTSTGRIISLASDQAQYRCYPEVQLPVQIYRYDDGTVADKQDPELSFSQRQFSILEGETFSAPELLNPENLPVVWTSSDETVATVAADGVVTVVGCGMTTVMASFGGNDSYNEGFATYTLTVMPVAADLAAVFAKATAPTVTVRVDFPVTVTGVTSDMLFVTDGKGYAMFATSLSYNVGDVIPAGWDCNTGELYGMRTVVPTISIKRATENVNVSYTTPLFSGLTDDDLFRVVVYPEVVFSSKTPVTTAEDKLFTGIRDGENLGFAALLAGTPSVDAGEYEVTCAVGRYEGNIVLMPLSFFQPPVAPSLCIGGDVIGSNETSFTFEKEAMCYFDDIREGTEVYWRFTEMTEEEGDPLNPSDDLLGNQDGFKLYDNEKAEIIQIGVRGLLEWYARRGEEKSAVKRLAFFQKTDRADMIAADGSEAEYFDLQGRRVASPENGLYIRKQGGKAVKVIVNK